MTNLKKTISGVLLFTLMNQALLLPAVPSAQALDLSLGSSQSNTPSGRGNATNYLLSNEIGLNGTSKGSEWISGDYPGAVLMKVNLWGSVNKSGIHYVPAGTDLITLLSFAGGPSPVAKLDDAFIKRWENGKEQVIKVDVEQLLKSTDTQSPTLKTNDIVVIPTQKPVISQDTATLVTVVATVFAAIASAIVLARQ